MKRRILFVDDEPNILNSLRRMLHAERSQWDMSFVDGAHAALDQMRTASFDAVVSDVNMPGKDGFALLAEIHSMDRTKDIPVIILTGRSESGIKRRALELGATDLLNKPIDPQDLIARLRNAIRLKEHQDELKAQNALLERKVEERTAELAESRLDIIWRLGKAADYRDEETGNHVVRVGCYCRAIAEALGADAGFVEMLFLASPLHDIGKIGIPDTVLLKRGPLREDEWELMKRHCAIGAEILRADPKVMTAFLAWRGVPAYGRSEKGQAPILKVASSIAMTHHEWWDGTGYPAGLAGEDIPLESRIVALSDTYDALRFERPYKPALPEAEALQIIRGEVGRHFDPQVHAAFEESITELGEFRRELRDEVRDLAGAACAL